MAAGVKYANRSACGRHNSLQPGMKPVNGQADVFSRTGRKSPLHLSVIFYTRRFHLEHINNNINWLSLACPLLIIWSVGTLPTETLTQQGGGRSHESESRQYDFFASSSAYSPYFLPRSGGSFCGGPPLPDRADAPSQPRCSLQLVFPQAMEAIFAGGWLYDAQWSNVTTHDQPGKIILWDEGPANAARSVPVGLGADKRKKQGGLWNGRQAATARDFVSLCKTFDSCSETLISFRKTSGKPDTVRRFSQSPDGPEKRAGKEEGRIARMRHGYCMHL